MQPAARGVSGTSTATFFQGTDADVQTSSGFFDDPYGLCTPPRVFAALAEHQGEPRDHLNSALADSSRDRFCEQSKRYGPSQLASLAPAAGLAPRAGRATRPTITPPKEQR